MPFSHTPKNPGDLIKSEDWNKALNAIVELFGKFSAVAGHQHSGSGEDAPQIKEAGIANNAITAVKILDGAVTAAKIPNGSITAAKVAAGTFSRDIGIAIMTSVTNGVTLPPPAGFTVQECIFFATAKFVNHPGGTAAWSYNITVDGNGKVTIAANGNVGIAAVGFAMAKRGGW